MFYTPYTLQQHALHVHVVYSVGMESTVGKGDEFMDRMMFEIM